MPEQPTDWKAMAEWTRGLAESFGSQTYEANQRRQFKKANELETHVIELVRIARALLRAEKEMTMLIGLTPTPTFSSPERKTP